jgi:hypothetical protein
MWCHALLLLSSMMHVAPSALTFNTNIGTATSTLQLSSASTSFAARHRLKATAESPAFTSLPLQYFIV